MAYADGNTSGCVLTIPSAQVDGDQTNFPFLISAANLPAAALDGGATSIEDGGGSLRAYLDDGSDDPTGGVRYALEVVDVTTGGSATAEVWCSILSLLAATGGAVFLSWGGGGSQPAADAAYGSEAVWSSDYEAVYHMSDDPSGGTLTDSTANANTGTPSGSMDGSDLVDGQIGKAWDFDGSNDRADLGTPSFTTDAAAGTALAWIKPAATTGDTFLNKGSNSSTDLLSFRVQSGNLQVLETTLNSVTGDTGLNAGTLYHCAITTSGSAFALYVDGAAEGLTVVGANTGNWFGDMAGANPFVQIGGRRYNGSYARYWDGLIDEVRILNTALSSTDVSTHYNTQSAPGTFATAGAVLEPPAAPAALTPFDDGNYYGCVLTIPAGQVDGDQTNFPFLISEANLPTGAINAGIESIEAGGGSLRAYLDDGSDDPTGGVRYALEVVDVTTGGSATAEVWCSVLSLLAATGGAVFLSWGDTGKSQPAADAAYGSEAVWSDYAMVQHLNEDPTGTPSATDSTSNDRDCTSSGSMTSDDLISDGQIGGAIDFDGSNDKLEFATSDWSGADFTASLWMRWTGGVEYVIGAHGGSPYLGWAIATGIGGAGDVSWWCKPTIGSWASSNAGYHDGAWHHVVVIANATQVYFSIDGADAGASGTDHRPGAFTGTAALGGRAAGTGITNSYSGDMDHVRLLPGVAWSVADATTHYNNESAPGSFASAGAIVTAPEASAASAVNLYYWYN